jgi:hypothetical protein
MKHCKDCRSLVKVYDEYYPKCSADLYARNRDPKGLMKSLFDFDFRVGR